jgi:Peptidase family M23
MKKDSSHGETARETGHIPNFARPTAPRPDPIGRNVARPSNPVRHLLWLLVLTLPPSFPTRALADCGVFLTDTNELLCSEYDPPTCLHEESYLDQSGRARAAADITAQLPSQPCVFATPGDYQTTVHRACAPRPFVVIPPCRPGVGGVCRMNTDGHILFDKAEPIEPAHDSSLWAYLDSMRNVKIRQDLTDTNLRITVDISGKVNRVVDFAYRNEPGIQPTLVEVIRVESQLYLHVALRQYLKGPHESSISHHYLLVQGVQPGIPIGALLALISIILALPLAISFGLLQSSSYWRERGPRNRARGFSEHLRNFLEAPWWKETIFCLDFVRTCILPLAFAWATYRDGINNMQAVLWFWFWLCLAAKFILIPRHLLDIVNPDGSASKSLAGLSKRIAVVLDKLLPHGYGIVTSCLVVGSSVVGDGATSRAAQGYCSYALNCSFERPFSQVVCTVASLFFAVEMLPNIAEGSRSIYRRLLESLGRYHEDEGSLPLTLFVGAILCVSFLVDLREFSLVTRRISRDGVSQLLKIQLVSRWSTASPGRSCVPMSPGRNFGEQRVPPIGREYWRYHGASWAPDKNHFGVDVVCGSHDSVKAVAEGCVVFAGLGLNSVQTVVIEENDWLRDRTLPLRTVYMNLSDVKVEAGQRVSRGQVIAKCARNWFEHLPSHLHMERLVGWKRIDPCLALSVGQERDNCGNMAGNEVCPEFAPILERARRAGGPFDIREIHHGRWRWLAYKTRTGDVDTLNVSYFDPIHGRIGTMLSFKSELEILVGEEFGTDINGDGKPELVVDVGDDLSLGCPSDIATHTRLYSLDGKGLGFLGEGNVLLRRDLDGDGIEEWVMRDERWDSFCGFAKVGYSLRPQPFLIYRWKDGAYRNASRSLSSHYDEIFASVETAQMSAKALLVTRLVNAYHFGKGDGIPEIARQVGATGDTTTASQDDSCESTSAFIVEEFLGGSSRIAAEFPLEDEPLTAGTICKDWRCGGLRLPSSSGSDVPERP